MKVIRGELHGRRAVTFLLPDKTKIELGVGSNLPPGAVGQHVSRNYPWFRVNDGEWQQTNHRSMLGLLEWIECCETIEDFLEGEAK